LTPPESVSEVENGVTDEDGEREMDLDVDAGPSGNEDGHQAGAPNGHTNGDRSEGEGADDEAVEEEECEWSDLDDGGEDGKSNAGQRPILHGQCDSPGWAVDLTGADIYQSRSAVCRFDKVGYSINSSRASYKGSLILWRASSE
jgi:hypothetical protein